MKMNIFFACMAIYTYACLLSSRAALKELERERKEQSSQKSPEKINWFNLTQSQAIFEMIFDQSLPMRHNSEAFTRKLTLARWMLLLYPIVFIGICILFIVV